MTGSTHLDSAGHARMVDVSEKSPTRRVARASGAIRMTAEALAAVTGGELPKGDAFAVARVAGIQAAKRTPDLVPLCHPLSLDHVAIEIEPDRALPGVRVRSEVVVTARTGAEMEALAAVAAALLTIYDMAKSLDRAMVLEAIRLESKAGGRSGDWSRGVASGVLAILVACAAAACDRGGRPASDPEGALPLADGREVAAADTQFVRDSLGNEIMIVSKRTEHLLPREVHPRAGSGDVSNPDGWRVIDPRTAHSLMQSARPPWYVLDVRSSRDYAAGGHIAGAALVPLAQLDGNVADLHVRTDQIVLIYADDEQPAATAARTLAGYGFPHLRVLGGGLAAWKQAGLPVEER